VLNLLDHDLLSVLQIAPDRRHLRQRVCPIRPCWSRSGAGLPGDFARALNQVDSFAGQLVTQVRQLKDKLKASFARRRSARRAAALALSARD